MLSANDSVLVLGAVGLLVLISAVGATGASIAPGNPPEPTTENYPPSDGANFTVVPDDPSPGTNTAYLLQSKGEGPWGDSAGLATIDFYRGNKASASGLVPEGEADT